MLTLHFIVCVSRGRGAGETSSPGSGTLFDCSLVCHHRARLEKRANLPPQPAYPTWSTLPQAPDGREGGLGWIEGLRYGQIRTQEGGWTKLGQGGEWRSGSRSYWRARKGQTRVMVVGFGLNSICTYWPRAFRRLSGFWGAWRWSSCHFHAFTGQLYRVPGCGRADVRPPLARPSFRASIWASLRCAEMF